MCVPETDIPQELLSFPGNKSNIFVFLLMILQKLLPKAAACLAITTVLAVSKAFLLLPNSQKADSLKKCIA